MKENKIYCKNDSVLFFYFYSKKQLQHCYNRQSFDIIPKYSITNKKQKTDSVLFGTFCSKKNNVAIVITKTKIW